MSESANDLIAGDGECLMRSGELGDGWVYKLWDILCLWEVTIDVKIIFFIQVLQMGQSYNQSTGDQEQWRGFLESKNWSNSDLAADSCSPYPHKLIKKYKNPEDVKSIGQGVRFI